MFDEALSQSKILLLIAGYENKTCRDICDRQVFCSECPIGAALKRLAEYENREEAHELLG